MTPATNGHNCLSGTVEEVIDAADGPSEVRITLPSGQILCSLAEPAQLAALQVKTGSPVQVQFAPSLVLLGTPL